ncbi:ABC transporter permease [Corynebacterium mastitidis]|uniref:ABC transporter permease n=1 Tax=Corynebacterium mastitidis TaxID=161890 RepID=A0ABU8NXX3_9CORY
MVEAIRLALGSMRTNKMRSLLTLLGIIIGIASVITIQTIGAAMKNEAAEGLARLGASDLQVSVQDRPDEDEETASLPGEEGDEEMYFYGSSVSNEEDELTPDMLNDLREQFGDAIDGVGIGENSYLSGNVVNESGESSVQINGVNPDYLRMNAVEVEYGRAITDEDLENNRKVVVLGPEAVDTLFHGDASAALGSEVSLISSDEDETLFRVVGVYKGDDQGFFGGGFGMANAYVPYTSFKEIASYSSLLSQVSVRLSPEADREQVKADIQGYFDGIYAANENAMVRVSDFQSQVDEVNSVIGSMSLAVTAIGGISLLVGGIGVMNIMLVTVTERTREIGVRKALGARRRDIRLQFIIEAMIVCLLGGIIGVLLGGALGMFASSFVGSVVLPPLDGVLISLLFSMAIGMFFGYYPANKAAKLNPIEALRYE